MKDHLSHTHKKGISYYIAYIILGRLFLYLWYFICGSGAGAYSLWSNCFFIWFKGIIIFSLLLINTFVNDKKFNVVLKLLAGFLATTVLWEIAVIIWPPLENNEPLITILFVVLISIVACITYLPSIKKIWQRLN